MFLSYLKIAWRAFLNSRTYSAMMVITLSIGLASCVLIVYYVSHELTFDHFHKNAKRIYRLSSVMEFPGGKDHMAITPDLLGPYLKENYSFVEDYVRMEVFPAHEVKFQGEQIDQEGFSYVDQNIFSVFGYRLIVGNPEKALHNTTNIAISKSTATRYFGDIYKALNQSIEVDNQAFIVTGVFDDLPDNTSLPKHGLIGYTPIEFDTKAMWRFNHFTFVMLKTENDASRLDAALQDVVKNTPPLSGMSFQKQALTDLHFTTDIKQDVLKGSKNYVLGFAAVALVLFCVVLFNYLNLAIVKALERLREVGIRKVIGAPAFELVKQFLSEAMLNLVIAGILAFALIQLMEPAFASITGKEVHFTWSSSLPFLLIALAILVVFILFISLYPALILASGKPVNMLNKMLTTSARGATVRSFLMTGQFIICGCVLTSFFIVGGQFKYIQNFDLGFTKDNITSIEVPTDSISLTKLRYLKKSLSKEGFTQVSLTTQSGNLLTGESFSDVVKKNTAYGTTDLHVIPKEVDGDFIEVMRIPLVQGKSFKEFSWEQWSSLTLINEKFVRDAGWKNPIGQKIELPYGLGELTVIGVMKDFHVSSLHNPMEAVMLRASDYSEMSYAALTSAAPPQTLLLAAAPGSLHSIKKVWANVFPDHDLHYEFLDDSFNKQYEAEKRTILLFSYFSILALTITGIGLYTILSYQLSLRTKEIGIRKVMGANTITLLKLLSKHTLIFVIIGSGVGLMLSWNAANWWLQSFAYKIEITSLLLILPTLVILLFGSGVCLLKILQASRTNPIEALRAE